MVVVEGDAELLEFHTESTLMSFQGAGGRQGLNQGILSSCALGWGGQAGF